MKILAATLTLVASAVAAQNLPPPSRTVYKCDDGKNVHYSDSPCLGATKVDVEPTRGLNKSTGQVRVGQDVQREKTNELMADALRPILNETPKQRETRHKRFKLESEVKAECTQLDVQIPSLEKLERSTPREALPAVQRDLLAVRTSFQGLRC
jgi:hypothetical protein